MRRKALNRDRKIWNAVDVAKRYLCIAHAILSSMQITATTQVSIPFVKMVSIPVLSKNVKKIFRSPQKFLLHQNSKRTGRTALEFVA